MREGRVMRWIRFSVIAGVLAVGALMEGAAWAEPSKEEVSEARQQYLRGDYSALAVISEAAEAGDAMALNILGAAYEEGRGVARDVPRAIELWERSAKAGEVRARYNLGNFYTFGGGGVEKDRTRARREYHLAAAAGYPPAMTGLGYLEEIAEPPNHEKSVEWYLKAHDAGDMVATGNVGYAYAIGRGVPEDFARARLYMTDAAARGLPRAFNDLGVLHQRGYGVAADPQTAYLFYRLAADKGYARAGINLAELAVEHRMQLVRPHVAMGYCIWGTEAAPERHRTGFQERCDALMEAIKPTDEQRARAREIADRI
jgi:TPR repeat protein